LRSSTFYVDYTKERHGIDRPRGDAALRNAGARYRINIETKTLTRASRRTSRSPGEFVTAMAGPIIGPRARRPRRPRLHSARARRTGARFADPQRSGVATYRHARGSDDARPGRFCDDRPTSQPLDINRPVSEDYVKPATTRPWMAGISGRIAATSSTSRSARRAAAVFGGHGDVAPTATKALPMLGEVRSTEPGTRSDLPRSIC